MIFITLDYSAISHSLGYNYITLRQLFQKPRDDLTYEEKKTLFSIMRRHNRYKPKPVYIGIFVSPITIFQSKMITECPR